MRKIKRVVVTGGPGAGKTAVLELVHRSFCKHVEVLPESASIIFKGGFPRKKADEPRRAVQRAIYHVQVELENVAMSSTDVSVLLCDRGTIDGLAYWPGSDETFWSDVGTTLDAELARYAAVIHLRTPSTANGYHKDAIRMESEVEAEVVDERLLAIWSRHPRRFIVESTSDFLEKVKLATALIRAELPPDCIDPAHV